MSDILDNIKKGDTVYAGEHNIGEVKESFMRDGELVLIVSGFGTLCKEQLEKDTHKVVSFIDDKEKMGDFFTLTKKEFLESYSYLHSEEYELTKEEVLKGILDESIPITFYTRIKVNHARKEITNMNEHLSRQEKMPYILIECFNEEESLGEFYVTEQQIKSLYDRGLAATEIKCEIKMRVTPEQNQTIQKIVFSHGGHWGGDCRILQSEKEHYLYIDKGMQLSYSSEFEKEYFEGHFYKQVHPVIFINEYI